jgi:hypothetical protein
MRHYCRLQLRRPPPIDADIICHNYFLTRARKTEAEGIAGKTSPGQGLSPAARILF